MLFSADGMPRLVLPGTVCGGGNMKHSYIRFLGALFLGGLASGFIATLPLHLGSHVQGVPFAAAVTLIFGCFRRIQSVWRGLLLFVACTLTLPVAIGLTLQIAGLTMSLWSYDLLSGRTVLLAFGICGYIGQFLILIAAALATSKPGWHAFARAFAWSLAGAGTAAFADAAIGWLPPGARWPGSGLMFLVWQPLGAVLMGLFVGQRPSAGATHRAW